MRLTIRTDLAMRALMYCAANPGVTVRKHEIALACNVSENHLAQVIHALGQRGFLATQRGRKGGLQLACAPEQISVGAVFRALEAEVPFTQCFSDTRTDCPLHSCCRLGCLLSEALEAFYARLDVVTLADLMAGNAPLQEILCAA